MQIQIHPYFNEPDKSFRQSVDARALKQNYINLIFKVWHFIQRLDQIKSMCVMFYQHRNAIVNEQKGKPNNVIHRTSERKQNRTTCFNQTAHKAGL